jgi:hypothetical protein
MVAAMYAESGMKSITYELKSAKARGAPRFSAWQFSWTVQLHIRQHSDLAWRAHRKQIEATAGGRGPYFSYRRVRYGKG